MSHTFGSAVHSEALRARQLEEEEQANEPDVDEDEWLDGSDTEAAPAPAENLEVVPPPSPPAPTSPTEPTLNAQSSQIEKELAALRRKSVANATSSQAQDDEELSHAAKEEQARRKELAELSKARSSSSAPAVVGSSNSQMSQVERELEELRRARAQNAQNRDTERILSHAEREEMERRKELEELSKLRAQRSAPQQTEHHSKQELEVEKELARLHTATATESYIGNQDVLTHAEREELETEKELEELKKMRAQRAQNDAQSGVDTEHHSKQELEVEQELRSLHNAPASDSYIGNRDTLSHAEREEIERRKELDELAKLRAQRKAQQDSAIHASQRKSSQKSEVERELANLHAASARHNTNKDNEEEPLSHAQREEMERRRELDQLRSLRAESQHDSDQVQIDHNQQEKEIERELANLHIAPASSKATDSENDLSHAQREEMERLKELDQLAKLRAEGQANEAGAEPIRHDQQEQEIEKELANLHNAAPVPEGESYIGNTDVLSHAEREELENDKELEQIAKLRAKKSEEPSQEDDQEDVQEDVQETVQEDIQETVQEDVQETVQENVQETVQETVQEDVQANAQESAQDGVVTEDIPEASQATNVQDEQHDGEVALDRSEEPTIIACAGPSGHAQGEESSPLELATENEANVENATSNEQISSTSAQEGNATLSSGELRFVALYDFDSEIESDLNFKVGDVVIKTGEADEAWWQGRLESTGEQGIFPKTYVEAQFEDVVGVSTEAAAPAVETEAVKETCVMAYDFPGEAEGDLPCLAEDTIEVLEHIDENWWRGRNTRTGEEGLFPKTYTK